MSGAPPRQCPALHTERLVLRSHSVDDFPDLLAMWRDPLVVRHLSGQPSTAEECWARLLRYAGLWPLLGYGYWCVRERATGRFVGDVGLADFGRDLSPSLSGWPEAGWVTAPWAHGRGFAREAAAAVFGWADDVLRAERTVCLIDPENGPSLRLAARLGFTPFAEATYRGDPSVLLERLAPTAPAGRGVQGQEAR